jgi:hypothetical protein
MVINAGSKLVADGDRRRLRVTFRERPHRLPDRANSGLRLEGRPGIVRLTRHAWNGRNASGRGRNIRRNQLEAEYWP